MSRAHAPLDVEAMLVALSAATRRQLGALRVLDRIDSTNSALLREPNPVQNSVLLAETQSAGRGRRGRRWRSPAGVNLYLSLHRRFQRPLPALRGLSLAVGATLAATLADLGVAGLGVKWPNDLLLDGRKLGGILIEFADADGGPTRAVIGIGLNVGMPEDIDGIDQPWADLGVGMAEAPDRNRLAAALLDRLLPALDRFEAEGLAAFLSDWRRFDALIGRSIGVIDGERVSPGLALGVAEDGALLVEHADGIRRHYSGEVGLRFRAGVEP